LMNVSGAGVKRAFGEWKRGKEAQGQEARLVVVHDELEAELGRVTVKDGAASAKGHNGLRAVSNSWVGLSGGAWAWGLGVLRAGTLRS